MSRTFSYFRKYFFILLFSLSILSMSSVGYAGHPLDASLAPMLKKVMPAIVNIKAKIKITDFNTLQELQKQKQLNNTPGQPLPHSFGSIGSGVIVDSTKGYILTNAHVVADAETIIVTLSDGRHFTGRTIGIDKPSDVALLQIKATNLTAITLANSSDLKVGDFVAAIGNPFGLNQTVTSGIVSAVGRTTLGIENIENFIQTDAPINPGNSGGALINMQGQLVGINTAILAPDRGSIGIGFAIPANMAKSVMLQLLQFGNVKRGLLGIGAQDLTPELANAFHLKETTGAAVTLVQPFSPANLAGMEVGDIITSINNIETKNSNDVVNTVAFLRVNSKITVKVLRKSKPINISIVLSDPHQRQQLVQQKDPFLYGVAFKDFKLSSPVHGNVNGVLVVAVEQESKAWQSDLRPGDVITSIDQEDVHSVDQLRQATSHATTSLLLHVLRGPSAVFLVINKE